MPRVRNFSRPVPRRSAFGGALQALRRARRRAIVAAIIAAIRQILPTRPSTPEVDDGGRPAEPPHPNDEQLLDEFLSGHEQGLRLGIRQGEELGYRRGVSVGFAQGLRQAQEEAYNAGFRDGLDDAHEYR